MTYDGFSAPFAEIGSSCQRPIFIDARGQPVHVLMPGRLHTEIAGFFRLLPEAPDHRTPYLEVTSTADATYHMYLDGHIHQLSATKGGGGADRLRQLREHVADLHALTVPFADIREASQHSRLSTWLMCSH
jgi:hypothetical protein